MKLGLLYVTAFVFAAGTLQSQASVDVLDQSTGKSVDELVRLALQNNGDLLAARQGVAATKGEITQARLRANPSVEFTGMKEAGGPQNSFMAGASLPLELFGRRDRRVEVAAANVRMAETDESERERRLQMGIESKFGDVLAAVRNLQFVNDLLGLNQRALKLTQDRVDQGAAPPLDANLLRVEVSRIDAMRADYEGKLGVAMLELKSLVGMNPQDDLRIRGSLDRPGDAIDKDEAVKRALEGRPDLAGARAAEQAASARLKQAQTEGRADASVSANYQRADSSFNINGITATGQVRPVQGIFHYLTAGVSISLPVRNKNEGSIQTAMALLAEATHRREYLELIARQEVMTALLSQQKAKESLAIYSQGVRDQASQNLDVIRRVNELGRTQLLDVIAEQRRFIEVETGYTETLSRNYQASVRLRAAVGFGPR